MGTGRQKKQYQSQKGGKSSGERGRDELRLDQMPQGKKKRKKKKVENAFTGAMGSVLG